MSEVLAGKRDELSGFSRVDGERIEQVRDCRTRTPRCGADRHEPSPTARRWHDLRWHSPRAPLHSVTYRRGSAVPLGSRSPG